ncbi:ABC transporter ATP-binding protein [Clostridium estertheticum]|uniref:ABC transporter ATP-binding protein n=1 Tax=Clostridium estertheticum TaxID=238834 RepID=UPI001CF226FB|nr:ABC transporter ATP-binding protein [Clostridium estertheticum]MCB2340539.1 ABC transporter ATP-binding protein/permease [Clostridium estertheticum]
MLKTIKRIIVLCGDKAGPLYVGFVLTFINTMFIAMPIMGAAYALNLVIKSLHGEGDITMKQIWLCTLFLVVSVLGRCIFTYLIASKQERVGYEVLAEQRLLSGNTLKRVPMGFFSSKNAGQVTAAVTTDMNFLETNAIPFIDKAVNGYISAITMSICMMIFNIWMGLIAIGGILLSSIFMNLLSKKSEENAPVKQKAQNDLVSSVIEYVRGMAIVKAFKQEGVAKQGIENAFEKSKNINIKIECDYTPINSLAVFSLKLASICIVFTSSMFAINGTMDIATMFMMVIFSFVIYNSVEQIGEASHMLRILDSALDHVESIKNAEFIDKYSNDKKLYSYDIKFDKVTFGYENRPILKDISFNIPENTTTAIIGPSGGGKSTICSLIARFYDVQKGIISIGSVNVKEITCDSLLSNISMVFQKVYLFHDTMLNNIHFGNPNATFEEVQKAAKKACCHDFIMQLPNGYDTVVGEGGSSLSGGEKQRISIARAILKDAPIVILDEATASVDPENENLIQEAISSLVHGKTIIIIAHRLATIQNANQILVVDNGNITQRGTHEELMNNDGIYKSFMKIREKSESWSIL